ncbi:MAG: RNA polymerase sigma factor [Lachnospiraceae bacterium]|nr:RNA polymerase sigma factor [Lachnospiraceae bacterium]
MTQEILTNEILKLKPSLYRAAFSVLKNHADAEDAVGETVIKAYEKYDGLKEDSALSSWIFRILYNISKRMYTNRKKSVPIEQESLFALAEECNAEKDPENVAMALVEGETIAAAVGSMDPRYGDVVRMYYFEGRSVSEIAGLLFVSEGTVKSRLYRARRELKKILSASVMCISMIFYLACFPVVTQRDENVFYEDTFLQESVVDPEMEDQSEIGKPVAKPKTESVNANDEDVSVKEELCQDLSESEDTAPLLAEERALPSLTSICFVEDVKDVDTDRVCYDLSTNTLFLPDRELTTEEMQDIEELRNWEKSANVDAETVHMCTADEKVSVSQNEKIKYMVTPESISDTPCDVCSETTRYDGFLAYYEENYSGTEADAIVYATTEEIVADMAAWRKRWLDAGRYDDTVPPDNMEDPDRTMPETTVEFSDEENIKAVEEQLQQIPEEDYALLAESFGQTSDDTENEEITELEQAIEELNVQNQQSDLNTVTKPRISLPRDNVKTLSGLSNESNPLRDQKSESVSGPCEEITSQEPTGLP